MGKAVYKTNTSSMGRKNEILSAGKEEEIRMNSAAVKNGNTTLPVSKWDIRIRDNKRRRNAEIRRHIFQLIFAVGIICLVFFYINSLISKAGEAKEGDISFKYYKNICLEQGETLTSVAAKYADEAHYETLDQYIQEVVYMNHLKNADDVRAGYYLIVPYYSNELL